MILSHIYYHIAVLIEFFALITYGQIMYDSTDIICISIYLKYLERLINNRFRRNLVIWEEVFGEGGKILNSERFIEKSLNHCTFGLLHLLYQLFGV